MTHDDEDIDADIPSITVGEMIRKGWAEWEAEHPSKGGEPLRLNPRRRTASGRGRCDEPRA